MTYKIWKKAPLFDDSFNQQEPSLMPFLLESENAPCVIVCPGGGYVGKAWDYEGTDVAAWLNTIGFSAFVLDYRVSPYTAHVPLMDLQRSIMFIRHNAKDFGIDKNRIGVMGFSAGGHLAASSMTQQEYVGVKSDETDAESCAPNFGVLCYPVITMRDFGHEGSMISLLGENPSENTKRFYCCEENVSDKTPQCFIWHTFEDGCVPLRNPLEFSLALTKHNVPHELHIFKKGGHGLGLATAHDKTACAWPTLCKNWLIENFSKEV